LFATCKSKIDNRDFRHRNSTAVKRSASALSLSRLLALFCFAPFVSALGQIVEIPTDADSIIRLEINRSHRQATLYRGAIPIKSYPVAVGRVGWETPTGEFHVFQMMGDPAWKHPLTRKVFEPGAAGNQLGHYWIGFWTDGRTAVGFHDTPHPKTVGKAMSHGCLRMYERDISELFGQVSVGTLVSVLP
jgi:lipoprotein-anchoring transpeptidase ErfK/SrfK